MCDWWTGKISQVVFKPWTAKQSLNLARLDFLEIFIILPYLGGNKKLGGHKENEKKWNSASQVFGFYF